MTQEQQIPKIRSDVLRQLSAMERATLLVLEELGRVKIVDQ